MTRYRYESIERDGTGNRNGKSSTTDQTQQPQQQQHLGIYNFKQIAVDGSSAGEEKYYDLCVILNRIRL